jgi:hypothetical protein
MTGHDVVCVALSGNSIMPLNEIPYYLGPETRRLIDLALNEAWQELKNDLPADPSLARRKMAGTIVALTSVGETDPAKLKSFALNALRGVRVSTARDGI